jgi:hypothetical protein
MRWERRTEWQSGGWGCHGNGREEERGRGEEDRMVKAEISEGRDLDLMRRKRGHGGSQSELRLAGEEEGKVQPHQELLMEREGLDPGQTLGVGERASTLPVGTASVSLYVR